MSRRTRHYWNLLAPRYFRRTVISLDDVHYGPLIPGDRALRLLPARMTGRTCLELGCGGAQNSIVLAARGALCTAVDCSEAMLRKAARLMRQARVHVNLVQADIQQLPLAPAPLFDLIHSAYALPFVEDGARAVREAARRLRPGGLFVLSTAHPAFAAEWVELDDGRRGGFLTDYFAPPEDRRRTRDGQGEAVCRAVAPSVVFEWLAAAGLDVLRFLEPRPSEQDFAGRADRPPDVPYWSEQWLECLPLALKFPPVAVFVARKPDRAG